MAVIGKVQEGKVIYAYDDDKKKGGEVRTKAVKK
jgi:hypothetical protein